MSPYEKITSLQNPKVKRIRQLRDKRGRDETELFVIDDTRDLQRALACGYQVEYLLTCSGIGDIRVDLHVDHAQVYEVSRDILEKVSYRENPSGVVAVMRQKPPKGFAQLLNCDERLILGLVNLQKPGNIGALLRTADAAGFGAIFLIDMLLDIYNPNIIRSSTGACFLDNLYLLTSQQARDVLKAHDYTVISAVPTGITNLYEVDFRRKSAILLGTEDKGLSGFWHANCELMVRIPMVGQVADSLNVSVSGAIMMYEALRQNSA